MCVLVSAMCVCACVCVYVATNKRNHRDVDEIVLDYISEVLGELGAEESSFNVDEFTEMVSAYVPEFSSIERYNS